MILPFLRVRMAFVADLIQHIVQIIDTLFLRKSAGFLFDNANTGHSGLSTNWPKSGIIRKML
jgi:hypothetical protein